MHLLERNAASKRTLHYNNRMLRHHKHSAGHMWNYSEHAYYQNFLQASKSACGSEYIVRVTRYNGPSYNSLCPAHIHRGNATERFLRIHLRVVVSKFHSDVFMSRTVVNNSDRSNLA